MERINAFIEEKIGGDRVIWGVIILLSLLSVMVVYSAAGHLYKGRTHILLIGQIGASGFGLLMAYIVHRMEYWVFKKYSFGLYLFGLGLLAATLVMGASLNNGSRWLVIPGIGISIQSSEVAKIFLMIYLARRMADYQGGKEEPLTGYLKMLAVIMAAVGLIFKENFSTAAMIFMVSMVLLVIGGVSLKYVSTTIVAAILAFVLLLMVSDYIPFLHRASTWKARIERYFSDEKDGENPGNYQAERARVAIVTGGVIGKGPGNSTQKTMLPHAYSDFAYAIIVEEYGLIGGMFVLGLYLTLVYRMGRIVRKCRSAFPALMVAGLTILFLAQSFINMSVSVGLMPVTGQTLPFVSKGGTSMAIAGFSFGVILSVSRYLQREESLQKSEVQTDV